VAPSSNSVNGYFKIQDQDDLREIREKVAGKLLTLDRALEPQGHSSTGIPESLVDINALRPRLPRCLAPQTSVAREAGVEGQIQHPHPYRGANRF